MNKSSDTEKKILEAAKVVFVRKGMAGARMQEIADEAGINKALLHYYFRSKEKLFEAVFKDAVLIMIPKLTSILSSDTDLFEKIRLFFDYHITFLQSNTYLPGFVLNELNQNPNILVETFLVKEPLGAMEKFIMQVKQKVADKEIIEIEPTQLLVNIISLSVFPVVAKPVMQSVLNLDEKKYNEILEQRKKEVAEFVINSIKIR